MLLANIPRGPRYTSVVVSWAIKPIVADWPMSPVERPKHKVVVFPGKIIASFFRVQRSPSGKKYAAP